MKNLKVIAAFTLILVAGTLFSQDNKGLADPKEFDSVFNKLKS